MHASTKEPFWSLHSGDLSSVMNIWLSLHSGQQRRVSFHISFRSFPGYQCSRKLIISLYQGTDTGFTLIFFWWCFFMHRILQQMLLRFICLWANLKKVRSNRTYVALYIRTGPPMLLFFQTQGKVMHLKKSCKMQMNDLWFIHLGPAKNILSLV